MTDSTSPQRKKLPGEEEKRSAATPEKQLGQDVLTGCAECAICLQVMSDNDALTRLSCGHLYHAPCIAGWLSKGETAPCPICREAVAGTGGPDTESAGQILTGSHQEVQRVVDEIDGFLMMNPANDGWVAVEAITNFLIIDLGYEDIDEFEDAINMPFVDLIRIMPHLELQMMTPGSHNRVDGQMAADVVEGLQVVRDYVGAEEGDAANEIHVQAGENAELVPEGAQVHVPAEQKNYMRLKPSMRRGAEGQRPRKFLFNVVNREDLWRIFHRAPGAVIIIPEMDDFEFGAAANRQVDSLHSFITNAILNLSEHVRMNRGGFNDEMHNALARTIDQLNSLLDVDEPFQWIVKCPTGVSSFYNMEGVTVTDIDANAEQMSIRPWEKSGQEAITGRELPDIDEEDEDGADRALLELEAAASKPAPEVDAVIWPDP